MQHSMKEADYLVGHPKAEDPLKVKEKMASAKAYHEYGSAISSPISEKMPATPAITSQSSPVFRALRRTSMTNTGERSEQVAPQVLTAVSPMISTMGRGLQSNTTSDDIPAGYYGASRS